MLRNFTCHELITGKSPCGLFCFIPHVWLTRSFSSTFTPVPRIQGDSNEGAKVLQVGYQAVVQTIGEDLLTSLRCPYLIP